MAPQRDFVQAPFACRGNASGPTGAWFYSALSSARKSSKVSSSNCRSGEFSPPPLVLRRMAASAPRPRRRSISCRGRPAAVAVRQKAVRAFFSSAAASSASRAPDCGALLFSGSGGYLLLSSCSPLLRFFRGLPARQSGQLVRIQDDGEGPSFSRASFISAPKMPRCTRSSPSSYAHSDSMYSYSVTHGPAFLPW